MPSHSQAPLSERANQHCRVISSDSHRAAARRQSMLVSAVPPGPGWCACMARYRANGMDEIGLAAAAVCLAAQRGLSPCSGGSAGRARHWPRRAASLARKNARRETRCTHWLPAQDSAGAWAATPPGVHSSCPMRPERLARGVFPPSTVRYRTMRRSRRPRYHVHVCRLLSGVGRDPPS